MFTIFGYKTNLNVKNKRSLDSCKAVLIFKKLSDYRAVELIMCTILLMNYLN